MDRLARDLRTLLEVVSNLDERGIALRILDFNGDTVDTKSATGRLTLQMFGAFAEFERTMMLERQRVGIEAAKAEGRYTGRKPKAMNQREQIKSLAAEGITKGDRVGPFSDISERIVFRALAQAIKGQAMIEATKGARLKYRCFLYTFEEPATIRHSGLKILIQITH